MFLWKVCLAVALVAFFPVVLIAVMAGAIRS